MIGAGGAGLRAAIEARLAGKKTAIISKSLFGKAHTVMAEGGAAAAMGNVNSQRQLDGALPRHHARRQVPEQLPDGRAARQGGAGADLGAGDLRRALRPHKDGKISQRNFGGHEYPRLAHVGDRTGLELIRTLQQKIVSLQQEDFAETGNYESKIRVFAETTITELMLDGDRVAGAFGYYRESGEFLLLEAPAVVLATGGVGRSYKVTSNSWEYTGDGHALALRAGATLINMEFLQFHPTGMVWPPSVKGILVTESVRGDGGVLRNSEGKRFMFDYVPDVFRKQYAETEEEADRWYTDPDNNRRPPELLPRDEVARAINSEVKAGRGTPAGGVYLDVATRLPAETDHQAAAVDVPPVQGTGRRRHHQGADGGRPDLPLRDGRRRGRPGLGGRVRHGGGPVRGRRGVRRHARLQPARRQLALRPAGLRQAGGRARRRRTSTRCAERPKVATADVEAAVDDGAGPAEPRRAARTRTRCSRICRR